jgi:hypothetical protein
MERKVHAYAPYVMKLLVHVVKDQGNLLEFTDIHHYDKYSPHQALASGAPRASGLLRPTW